MIDLFHNIFTSRSKKKKTNISLFKTHSNPYNINNVLYTRMRYTSDKTVYRLVPVRKIVRIRTRIPEVNLFVFLGGGQYRTPNDTHENNVKKKKCAQ